MGENNLDELSNNDICSASSLNQYKDALSEDHVPRNSLGVPEDKSGSLGTSDNRWTRSYIKNGCWSAGDIKAHHSYDSSAEIGQGWFPCDGTIINETNYDSLFGEGSWNIYVRSTALDGKYSPNLVSKYLAGTTLATQEGTSEITSVGNANNEVTLTHNHTSNGHTHQWYSKNTGSTANNIGIEGTYSTEYVYTGTGYAYPLQKTSAAPALSMWTSNVGPSTDYNYATTTTIQPESIEIIYYIRII